MEQSFQRFTVPIKNVPNNNEVSVVILGADVAPRKKNQGAKSLIPFGSKSNMIEMQIVSIKNALPKSEIILVTGFQSQQVITKGYPVRIVENLNYNETSDVEQIRIALNAVLNKKVLIINGDLAFDSLSIMNITNHGSNTLFNPSQQENNDSIGVIHNNNKLENLIYCTANKWLHCVYLEGKELEIMRKFVRNKVSSKLLFFEAVNYVASNGLIRALPQQTGTMYRIGE